MALFLETDARTPRGEGARRARIRHSPNSSFVMISSCATLELFVVEIDHVRGSWEDGEMTSHKGGCLCGGIRYEALAEPSRVTVCHCRFCQKATGSAYMVEPIFDADHFALLSGEPEIYDQVSEGSGKIVHIHFCPSCGTKLWLSFERFPDAVGVYAGTFDDPCWFSIAPAISKHIFLGVARPDTVIPEGMPTFIEHATTNDGTPQEATVFDTCQQIGSR